MPPALSDLQRRAQRGNTLLGLIIGLVIGLAIAVAVAIYITNAPLPFVNKVKPAGGNGSAPKGELPDPNRAVNQAANTAPPSATPSLTPPAAPATPAATAPSTQSAPAASAAPAATAKIEPAKEEPAVEGARFLLQAGAFKSADEAEGMRAQLALVGLDARVFPVEQGGLMLFRVRLGPYGQLDDVNRVRRLLADNGIEAQIVRLR
jgi:cell division protein FtsN